MTTRMQHHPNLSERAAMLQELREIQAHMQEEVARIKDIAQQCNDRYGLSYVVAHLEIGVGSGNYLDSSDNLNKMSARVLGVEGDGESEEMVEAENAVMMEEDDVLALFQTADEYMLAREEGKLNDIEYAEEKTAEFMDDFDEPEDDGEYGVDDEEDYDIGDAEADDLPRGVR